MVSICKLIEVALDDVPNDSQYDYIKDKCGYYLKIWDINRELLDSSMVYEDLF